MNWPSLSVIIPSYNQGRYIERTLLSILGQNYPGTLQVIVSDGGSTDETVAVLKKYPQVQWWSEQDKGFVDAVTKGLAAATGEIVAIQSSDDYYLEGAFAKAISVLQQQGPQVAFVSGADVILHDEGYHCDLHPQPYLSLVSPGALLVPHLYYVPQHCTFLRRTAIDSVGGLRERVDQCADFDLWYRLLHFHQGLLLPDFLAVYQRHSAQRTQAQAEIWIKSLEYMVESCEREDRYSRRFQPSPMQKRETFRFWQIIWRWRTGGPENLRKSRALAEDVMRQKDQWSEQMRQHVSCYCKKPFLHPLVQKTVAGLKVNSFIRKLAGKETLELTCRTRLKKHGIDIEWWRAS